MKRTTTSALLVVLLLTVAGFAANAQTVKNLDSLFQSLAADKAFNGSVLIAENGIPVYEKTFGYADFDTRQPMGDQTMFELASVSKQFTAMAIMQLSEQGKLAYADSLGKYFPGLPYPGVTIRHLLQHTSGIPEFLGWDEKLINTGQVNNNQDVLNSLKSHAVKPHFKAGEMLSYSNTNYVLLALIVEKCSGMPFAQYMDKYIFKPLEMNRSRVYGHRNSKPGTTDVALGHSYDPAKGTFAAVPAKRYYDYFDGVGGPYGISSTPRDLLKWDQALYTEKLISFAGQEQAYQPFKLGNGKTASLLGLPYGFGWLVLPVRAYSGKGYMHTGGYAGYASIIVRYPEKRKTVIVLSNTFNSVSILALGGAIESILFERPFTIPKALPFKKSALLSPTQLEAVSGTYTLVSAPEMKIIISTKLGQVYAQLSGQQEAEIYPESETDFFYTIVNATIRFSKDKAGKMNKLVLSQNGMQLEATRNLTD